MCPNIVAVGYVAQIRHRISTQNQTVLQNIVHTCSGVEVITRAVHHESDAPPRGDCGGYALISDQDIWQCCLLVVLLAAIGILCLFFSAS